VVIGATTLWIRRIAHRYEPKIVTPAPAAPSASSVAEVVVATRGIEPGDMIEPTFIGVERRRRQTIPAEAFSHVDNVMGRIARVNIDAGEVITTARLAGPFTPKLDLPHPRRTLMLRVDSRASDATIQPNTNADLLLASGLGDRDRLVETIVEDVRVVHIDSTTENRPNATWHPITVATIEVTNEQQEHANGARTATPAKSESRIR